MSNKDQDTFSTVELKEDSLDNSQIIEALAARLISKYRAKSIVGICKNCYKILDNYKKAFQFPESVHQ